MSNAAVQLQSPLESVIEATTYDSLSTTSSTTTGSLSPTASLVSVNDMFLNFLNRNLSPRMDSGSMAELAKHKALTIPDLKRLELFRNETLVSMTKGFPGVSDRSRQEMMELSMSRSYLMHAYLTLAGLHERHLGSKGNESSAAIFYHWQKTCSNFNQVLSRPLRAEDADALYMTAILLNSIGLASVKTSDPYQSWPVRVSHDDLEWLRTRRGILLMYLATKHLQTDSNLSKIRLQSDYAESLRLAEHPQPDISDLEPTLAQLCGIHDPASAQNSPYREALRSLSPLLKLTCNDQNLMEFVVFIGTMPDDFVDLLRKKDVMALVILGRWYAKICHVDRWWLSNRATLECTSICIYLDRLLHAQDPRRPLLAECAEACGYELRDPKKTIKFNSDDDSPWAETMQFLQPCPTM